MTRDRSCRHKGRKEQKRTVCGLGRFVMTNEGTRESRATVQEDRVFFSSLIFRFPSHQHNKAA